MQLRKTCLCLAVAVTFSCQRKPSPQQHDDAAAAADATTDGRRDTAPDQTVPPLGTDSVSYINLHSHSFGTAQNVTAYEDGTYLETISGDPTGCLHGSIDGLYGELVDVVEEEGLADAVITQPSDPTLICDGGSGFRFMLDGYFQSLDFPCVPDFEKSTQQISEAVDRLRDAIAGKVANLEPCETGHYAVATPIADCREDATTLGRDETSDQLRDVLTYAGAYRAVPQPDELTPYHRSYLSLDGKCYYFVLAYYDGTNFD